MDLDWFDDVLVLLEERNMTRAAERRNITQPAFSRRIRSFEEWLGTPILDRQSNRIEINQALTANEDELRALVARIQEIRAGISSFQPTRQNIAIAAQHAPLVATFPDMALRARLKFPGINFRPRAGNLHDCVTLFLRGDVSMLLCYQAENARPLEFGAGVASGVWGTDYLVPVVGGALRFSVRDNGEIPEDTSSIAYPEDSYFGQVLGRAGKRFGTPSTSIEPVCVTAFSSGTKELVLRGIGIGWVPYSMVHKEVAGGDLVSLANHLGREPLQVAVFADGKNSAAADLLKYWAK